MELNKEEKEIIKHLIKKEIKETKKEENTISFPTLNFLKSVEMYEEKLD